MGLGIQGLERGFRSAYRWVGTLHRLGAYSSSIRKHTVDFFGFGNTLHGLNVC